MNVTKTGRNMCRDNLNEMSRVFDSLYENQNDEEDFIDHTLPRIAVSHPGLNTETFELFLLDAEASVHLPTVKRRVIALLGLIAWRRQTITAATMTRLAKIAFDHNLPFAVRQEAVVAVAQRFNSIAGTSLESLHRECLISFSNFPLNNAENRTRSFVSRAIEGHRVFSAARSLIATGKVHFGENELNGFLNSKLAIESGISKLGRDWVIIQLAMTKADPLIWNRACVRSSLNGIEVRTVLHELLTPQGTSVACRVVWKID